MINTLSALFTRDLNRLKIEIEAYSDENNIWRTDKNIANSAGNLCLHLLGNLNTYIGAALAHSGYVRQRDLEFSLKNIPRAELVQRIDDTIVVVEQGLNLVTEEELKGNFPVVIWDKETGMKFTLAHLLTHLNYHLGQINYHRRLLDV